ncbi:MAG: energy transducer TonB [Candidatus Pacebacteria bacterium]|jgi:protein TonB|nr:energy transducer TonB [Candidatus Paceibacterota bacterium]
MNRTRLVFLAVFAFVVYTTAPAAIKENSGSVKVPPKWKDVRPVYPAAALEAKAEGQVWLEIVVDKYGHVTKAKVIKSVPLLDQAAREAVLQWKYLPLLLNKVAVSFTTTVKVNFKLPAG